MKIAMTLVSIGFFVFSAAILAFAWATSRWGLEVIERRFSLWTLPSLELLGRERDGVVWFEVTLCGVFLSLTLGVAVDGPALALLLALPAGAAPPLVLFHLARKRIESIDRQLPAALDALASALRSGQSMVQAVQWVATEGPTPINQEFGHLKRELALGRTLEVGLQAMSQRVPSKGLKSLVMAVGPLRAMGANLIPALEGLADILRRRAGMDEKLGSLAAQAKMQLWVMGLMLPVLMLILFTMDPKLIGRLFASPQGNVFLAVAALLQLLGIFLASRILNPKQIWK